MWLAESYEYSADYKTLTIKTRPNVTWSDGEPFSAEDVAYTFNQLVEVGSKVNWGADVQQFLDAAEATDENTVVFNFKVPAPRFFDFVAYKFDIGVYIVPEAHLRGSGLGDLRLLRYRQGLAGDDRPLARRLLRDQSRRFWTAPTTGGASRRASPSCRRRSASSICPIPGEQGLISGIIANQYDIDTGIQPAELRHRLRRQRQGHHLDRPGLAVRLHRLVAALALLNNEVRPWSDKNVRWAISYYLDRDQIIDIAWTGASLPSTLFVPDYPPLKPFLDAVQPTDRAVPVPGVQPGQGRRTLSQGLDQRRRRHVAGRDRRSRSRSRSSASSTSPRSARSSSSS